jgi:rSAM/selenodomain-associated transferase 2
VELSVIIPALNEAANIRRAIESSRQAGASEVLVADGGSDDATPRIAAELGCPVIDAPRGRASQQNAAARLARGDVLLFLHADNALAGNIAAQIESALASPRVLHGALRQRIEAPGLAYRWLERGNAARARWLGLPYGDQAIFLCRSVFEEIGGFPDVPLLEDLIVMQRLKRLGWPVLLPGPVLVSPRRWQRHGIAGQTLRNWRIVAEYSCGVSPERLASRYLRHDSDDR